MGRTSSLKSPLKDKSLVRQTLSAGDTLPLSSSRRKLPPSQSSSTSSLDLTDDGLSTATLDHDDLMQRETVIAATTPNAARHTAHAEFLSEAEMKERVRLILSLTRRL